MTICINNIFQVASISIYIAIIATTLSISSCNYKQEMKAKTTLVSKIDEKSWVDTTFNRLLDQMLVAKLDSNQCPGLAVLIMKENQVIFEKEYGKKSILGTDIINQKTMFRLGSVSKGFAGILAAILIDNNLIHLDDPLSLYIPEIKIKAKNEDKILRVKHILSHSTGFTEHAYSNLVDENRSMDIIFEYLNKLTPRDSTGKAYAYQNATFGLIEKVIESATGLSYENALDYYIFSPLQMCQTNCTFDEITSSTNVCTGHKYYYKTKSFAAIDLSPHYYNVVSAGGVNSSLSDMQKWLNAVMGYRPDIISDHARELAFTPYIDTSSDDKYYNNWPGFVESHYGLGWRIIHTDHHDLVYHGGMVNGFRTEIMYDKTNKIGLVMLFNSVCGYSNQAVPSILQLWDKYHHPAFI